MSLVELVDAERVKMSEMGVDLLIAFRDKASKIEWKAKV